MGLVRAVRQSISNVRDGGLEAGLRALECRLDVVRDRALVVLLHELVEHGLVELGLGQQPQVAALAALQEFGDQALDLPRGSVYVTASSAGTAACGGGSLTNAAGSHKCYAFESLRQIVTHAPSLTGPPRPVVAAPPSRRPELAAPPHAPPCASLSSSGRAEFPSGWQPAGGVGMRRSKRSKSGLTRCGHQ